MSKTVSGRAWTSDKEDRCVIEGAEITGWQVDKVRRALWCIPVVLTFGLLLMIAYWRPDWALKLTHNRAPLSSAPIILYREVDGRKFVRKVYFLSPTGKSVASESKHRDQFLTSDSLQYFMDRKVRYIFIKHLNKYARVQGLDNEAEWWPISRSDGSSNEVMHYTTNPKPQVYSPTQPGVSISVQNGGAKQFSGWNPGALEQDPNESIRRKDIEEETEANSNQLFSIARGISEHQRAIRVVLYGLNLIVVKITPIPLILFKEVFTPFYVFQVFSVTVWYIDEYYYFATVVIIMSLISLTTGTYQTYMAKKSLHDMAVTSNSSYPVTIVTPDGLREISSESLLPGDVVILRSPAETKQASIGLLFDAVLLSGECVVKEASLTGESLPITKSAVSRNTPIGRSLNANPGVGSGSGSGLGSGSSTETKPAPGAESQYSLSSFDLAKLSRNSIYAGTQLLTCTKQTRKQPVTALVVRIGFQTAKGELIRSIMYPRPVNSSFNKQAGKFLLFLLVIAVFGVAYSLYSLISNGAGLKQIIIRSLTVITIVIPPALPASMTIGILFAQRRLKDKQIFCTSPSVITLAGSINLFAFDKTGTLTEDGLDMRGVLSCSLSNNPDPTLSEVLLKETLEQPSEFAQSSLIRHCLAACHSLSEIKGLLVGDPLEIKMLEASGWTFEQVHMNESDLDDSTDNQEKDRELMTMAFLRPNSESRNETGVKINGNIFEGKVNYGSSVISIRPYEMASNEFNEGRVGSGVGEEAHPPILVKLRFAFTPALQRSSTLVSYDLSKVDKGRYPNLPRCHLLFSKGAPEMIASLCHPSTVPTNFANTLKKFTSMGFRVLALAYREVNGSVTLDTLRDSLENSLSFLGLIVLENRLKPQSAPVLQILSNAAIRTLMVTGDNQLTAASVARECGIVGKRDPIVSVQAELLDQTGTGSERSRGISGPGAPSFSTSTTASSVDLLPQLNEEDVPGMRYRLKFSFEDGSPIAIRLDQIPLPNPDDTSEWNDQMLLGANAPPPLDPSTVFPPRSILSVSRRRLYSTKSESQSVISSINGVVNTSAAFRTHIESNPLSPELPCESRAHLSMIGDTFGVLYREDQETLKKLLLYGSIFARMLPEQKQQLLELLGELGFVCGMCGDGCNDCGALKAAHAGISLSEAEASVAAPFTSRQAHIGCVTTLVSEGRAGLVTAIATFRFMALYSLAQFSGVLIFYTFALDFTDLQFLYVDLVLATFVSLTMGLTRAEEVISALKPITTLAHFIPMLSILINLAIMIGFQLLPFIHTREQPWYTRYQDITEGANLESNEYTSYENTILFILSNFFYTTIAFLVCGGTPFRKPFYTNYIFTGMVFLTLGVNLIILLWAPPFIDDIFDLMPLPVYFYRILILLLAIACFLVCYCFEEFVLNSKLSRRLSDQAGKLLSNKLMAPLKKRWRARAMAKANAEARKNGLEPQGQVPYSTYSNSNAIAIRAMTPVAGQAPTVRIEYSFVDGRSGQVQNAMNTGLEHPGSRPGVVNNAYQAPDINMIPAGTKTHKEGTVNAEPIYSSIEPKKSAILTSPPKAAYAGDTQNIEQISSVNQAPAVKKSQYRSFTTQVQNATASN